MPRSGPPPNRSKRQSSNRSKSSGPIKRSGRSKSKPNPSRKFVSTRNQIRSRRKQRHLFRTALAAIIAIIIAFLGFILFSEKFNINSLSVTGPDESFSAEISDYLKNLLNQKTYFVSNKNQFLWTKSRLENQLNAQFPSISEIDFAITDGEMMIDYNRHEPAGIWCQLKQMDEIMLTSNTCTAISLYGDSFEISNIEKFLSNKQLPVITDAKPKPASGQKVISSDLLSDLVSLVSGLDNRGYQTEFTFLQTDQITLHTTSNQELEIKKIIMPLQQQRININNIADLYLVLDQNELAGIASRENIASFTYLDFTSPNKLFYKFVTNEEIPDEEDA